MRDITHSHHWYGWNTDLHYVAGSRNQVDLCNGIYDLW